MNKQVRCYLIDDSMIDDEELLRSISGLDACYDNNPSTGFYRFAYPIESLQYFQDNPDYQVETINILGEESTFPLEVIVPKEASRNIYGVGFVNGGFSYFTGDGKELGEWDNYTDHFKMLCLHTGILVDRYNSTIINREGTVLKDLGDSLKDLGDSLNDFDVHIYPFLQSEFVLIQVRAEGLYLVTGDKCEEIDVSTVFYSQEEDRYYFTIESGSIFWGDEIPCDVRNRRGELVETAFLSWEKASHMERSHILFQRTEIVNKLKKYRELDKEQKAIMWEQKSSIREREKTIKELQETVSTQKSQIEFYEIRVTRLRNGESEFPPDLWYAEDDDFE